MPSRWISVAIILGWLTTTSWLVYTEFVPLLLPGQPPAFSIDLVEEVHVQRMSTRWVVLREGVKVFAAQTHVERVGDGVFEMGAKYSPYSQTRGKNDPVIINGVKIQQMESAYRVNAAGDLLGVKVFIAAEAVPVGTITLDVVGEVRNGEMAPQVKLSLLGQTQNIKVGAVKVPRGGSMMMPLHPVNRITGLRQGHAWTMLQYDPFKELLPAGLAGDSAPKLIRARVRDELESYSLKGRSSEPCFVIDYKSDDLESSIWVDEKTGRVVRQQALYNNERWEMERD